MSNEKGGGRGGALSLSVVLPSLSVGWGGKGGGAGDETGDEKGGETAGGEG